MGTTRLDAIGSTSLFVAALRAKETLRPDRLVDDPFAARFLDAAGVAGVSAPGDVTRFVELMADQVALRTRYLDDALLAAGCRQVVLVAAGMDSRAFRLPWPAGVEVFELDQPAVLSFKDEALDGAEPRCVRHAVGVDLREDWSTPLLDAGFRVDRPTAWLAEGLLYALTPWAADVLLETVGSLCEVGSMIAFDHIQMSDAMRRALLDADPGLVDLWQGGPTDPQTWLRQHDWRPRVEELADTGRRRGRPVHPAYDPAADGAHSWLVTAAR
ncbi:SAM-dependent methyltransferase [Actinophytocola oryzae]|uniref:S-adenosyl-L-methionine-dependent methyltransferase n=1 Tax=Actinophytocola oryzae TaxID=502181 RepID=A0A4R7VKB4_9PSEU|nr:SAM-dependent methyltransferase [Actinophytocola oryzae]TDV49913.1 methyltransferase (TIGR00027 family) [Actinophytocola oryzae]